MIWVQAGVMFVLWLIVGFVVWRTYGVKGRVRPRSRLGGPILMIFGGLVMVAGMMGIANSGAMSEGRLTVAGWLATAGVGSVFVAFQTLGTVLVMNALGVRETGQGADASEGIELVGKEGKDQ